jgi:hypothetical protein
MVAGEESYHLVFYFLLRRYSMYLKTKTIAKTLTAVLLAMIIAVIPLMKVTAAKSKDSDFEEITVVDIDETTVTITDIDEDGTWGYTLKVTIENKSEDITYMYTIDNDSDFGWIDRLELSFPPDTIENMIVDVYTTLTNESNVGLAMIDNNEAVIAVKSSEIKIVDCEETARLIDKYQDMLNSLYGKTIDMSVDSYKCGEITWNQEV